MNLRQGRGCWAADPAQRRKAKVVQGQSRNQQPSSPAAPGSDPLFLGLRLRCGGGVAQQETSGRVGVWVCAGRHIPTSHCPTPLSPSPGKTKGLCLALGASGTPRPSRESRLLILGWKPWPRLEETSLSCCGSQLWVSPGWWGRGEPREEGLQLPPTQGGSYLVQSWPWGMRKKWGHWGAGPFELLAQPLAQLIISPAARQCGSKGSALDCAPAGMEECFQEAGRLGPHLPWWHQTAVWGRDRGGCLAPSCPSLRRGCQRGKRES